MRITTKILTTMTFLTLFFIGCSKDDVMPEAPIISNIEFGHDNNKTAYIGVDLHVEAEISAPGKIDNIKVELHPESGQGWEYNEVFKDEFDGLLNAVFHKHIQISKDAEPGEYHIHFVVTDKNGKQTSEEAHIQVINDPSLPSVSNYSVHIEDNGNTLHIEAEITAPNKIAEVEVEIHGPWEEDFEYDDADMVGKTFYHFSKYIDISNAPSGHYHIHLGITDQAGKNIEFEEHFNK